MHFLLCWFLCTATLHIVLIHKIFIFFKILLFHNQNLTTLQEQKNTVDSLFLDWMYVCLWVTFSLPLRLALVEGIPLMFICNIMMSLQLDAFVVRITRISYFLLCYFIRLYLTKCVLSSINLRMQSLPQFMLYYKSWYHSCMISSIWMVYTKRNWIWQEIEFFSRICIYCKILW